MIQIFALICQVFFGFKLPSEIIPTRTEIFV